MCLGRHRIKYLSVTIVLPDSFVWKIDIPMEKIQQLWELDHLHAFLTGASSSSCIIMHSHMYTSYLATCVTRYIHS